MEFNFDVNAIREQFPACAKTLNGYPIVRLDSPAGSQVPKSVTDAISDYLTNHNANEGGYFAEAVFSEQLEDLYREAAADFLGCDAYEIGFGWSTTQNSSRIAYSILKDLKPGDEVVITQMEHRASSAPWIEISKHYDIILKTVRVDPKTCQVDLEDLRSKLGEKTKVAVFNWASNVVGTVSDVKKMCAMAHEYGAITIIDAVHYAAHFPIDVKDIDTDILLCSAYKWFGPHIGVLYMRKELVDSLDICGVKTLDTLEGPRQFHFGTPQYELLAGVIAAVDFIASVGEQYAAFFEDRLKGLTGRRRNVVAGMLAIDEYEAPLGKMLRDGLSEIDGLTMYGPAEGELRTPTVPFTVKGRGIDEIANALAENGINAWHGDFYAVELVFDALGLGEYEGVVRLGLAPYNTEEDIIRTLEIIRKVVA